jgi:two-component system chemotaxis response regulator CheY
MKKILENLDGGEYIEIIEKLLDLCAEREKRISSLESNLVAVESQLIEKDITRKKKKAAPKKIHENPDPMKSVIIAEDCEIVQHMLLQILAKHGISVLGVADNGLDAVELFKRHKPGLTLMDLYMPIMDGIEATRRILDHDSSAKVLILTADNEKGTVVKALQAGASEYITKPVEASSLLRVIKYYLLEPEEGIHNRSTEFIV